MAKPWGRVGLGKPADDGIQVLDVVDGRSGGLSEAIVDVVSPFIFCEVLMILPASQVCWP